jgi:hypothetical protein
MPFWRCSSTFIRYPYSPVCCIIILSLSISSQHTKYIKKQKQKQKKIEENDTSGLLTLNVNSSLSSLSSVMLLMGGMCIEVEFGGVVVSSHGVQNPDVV